MTLCLFPRNETFQVIMGGLRRGRSIKDSKTHTTPKKSRTEHVQPFALVYFNELIEKTGLKLNFDDSNHILKCEPLKFLDELKSTLENNVDYPRNVMEFIKGFEICSKDENLYALIKQNNVLISPNSDNSRLIQTSVVRLFLTVNCLQEHLIKCIMDRAIQIAIDKKIDQLQLLLKLFSLLDSLTAEPELVKRLIELLEVGDRAVKLEVIISLPDIITQLEHQNISLELCRFMREDYELTPAILDCLSYFSLSSEYKISVRDEMLKNFKSSAPLNFFPNLVNFFLVGCASELNIKVIQEVRSGLDWTQVGNNSTVDIDNSQIMTALALKTSFLKSRTLITDWIKVLNSIKTATEHKPIDIIILIILYSLKIKVVENIFCKKIKFGLFTSKLLQMTIKKHKSIFIEYITDIIELARMLLKTKVEPSIVRFEIEWFIYLITELTDVRKIIIDELINHEQIDEKEFLANTISIFSKIIEIDVGILKPFSLQCLNMLNKIDILNISETRQLMNLLCGLAFGVENSLLQDDINMIIRKQLSSSDFSIKKRGIVGGIMAIKHIIKDKYKENIIISEDEYTEIQQLPEGSSKEAALMVDLILKSTNRFSEMACYFYDEFYNMSLQCKGGDQIFFSWFTHIITENFQDNFIVDVIDDNIKPINGIELCEMYCLNTSEDTEQPIALNIANIVLNKNITNIDLRILPSWFRILQMLHYITNNKDLSSIGALLGCGIIIPVVKDENSLEEFNGEYINQIIDCFVYCINWFRELISAFCSQNDNDMKKKVLERLNILILLEKKLGSFIRNSSADYKFPLFTSGLSHGSKQKPILSELQTKVSKKSQKNKNKRGQNNSRTDELNASNVNLEDTTQDHFINQNMHFRLNSALLRQMQFSIVSLLSGKLIIDESNLNNSDETGALDLDTLSFLLQEVNVILSEIFLPNNTKKGDFYKSTDSTNVMEAFNKCLIIIPQLCSHLEKIGEVTQQSLDLNDGVRDAIAIFTEQNNKAQLCLGYIFNTFNIILSWSEITLSVNKQNLLTYLKILANKCDLTTQIKQSLKDLVLKISVYFLKYKDWCLVISTAVKLVNFFYTLSKITNDKSVNERLIDLSMEMLSIEWKDSLGDIEKGLHFNQHVNTLLEGYFSYPNLNFIKTIVFDLDEHCQELLIKNHVLHNFQCISKSNFPLLFRIICKTLYEITKNDLDNGLTDNEHIELWKNVAIIMKVLTDILKKLENRSNITAFLKKSIPLLKLFLSHGMPMMDMKLKINPDSFVEILRTLQQSTRFLHSLCCHSRLKKDTSLMAYLPQLKLTLETLVYKVKASLIANDCSQAFWMGNLKNKNLQGEFILSQNQSVDENDDEDEQLPVDESSASDNDIDDSDMKSVSNIV